MKRFASVLMAVFLAFALTVPAFAANDGHLPYQIEDDSCYILYTENGTEKIIWVTSHTSDEVSITYDSGKFNFTLYEPDTMKWNTFERRASDGIWQMGAIKSTTALYKTFDLTNCTLIESGQNIVNMADGSLYYPFGCDGTSCPATDADKNNVCDDCGNMLVMSLRTSLLEFARYHVEESIKVYAQMPYWLITEDAAGGYTCIISQQPLTYSNNTLYTGGNMRVGTAKILSSGENAATAWDHISTGSVPVDGEAVDANYKIEGFFPTPLWRMMNKVTQGEMGLLTGETVGTMKIMALSGVGCLALLMVLKLFGKRSLMFLR